MSHLLAAIAASAVATTACKKTPTPAPDQEPETRSTPTKAPTDWELGDLDTVNATSPVQGIAIVAPELDSYGKAVEHEVTFEYGRHCLNKRGRVLEVLEFDPP